MSRRTIRLTVEYEGTDFRGFAAQPGLRTVEGELSGALVRMVRDEARLTPGGRTDSGVHARGQVVSFSAAMEVPAAELREALNALTGPDIWVREVVDAEPAFDARRDARSRRYEYRVWNAPEANLWERRWTAHVADPLDVDAMEAACRPLVGRHDFGAFYTHRAQDDTARGTVRRVHEVGWSRDALDSRLLRFEIEADAFLRHMVRCIVGSSLLVGLGKIPVDGIAGMLEQDARAAAGPTAPAAGLTLVEVSY